MGAERPTPAPRLVTPGGGRTVSAQRMVERGKLLALLRTHHRRLTLIHAPAGYGKTTLALQWTDLLVAEGATVAWLNLTPADSSPTALVSHLLDSVKDAIGECDDGALAAITTALEQHPDDADRFVLAALHDRIQRHGKPLLIALDDWHLVDHPRATATLGALVDLAPANLSVLVTTRNRPPLPLSRWRVRDQLTEIGPEQLRFDAGESRAFLVDLNNLPLTSDAVDQLIDSADGWVAALQLASLTLRERPDSTGLIAGLSGRHHALAEYLTENVLDSLPPEVLDVLLRTSVADRLHGELVNALTGRTDGHALLEEIQRRDLFLRPLDPEHTWFRYHHLFTEHLRGRLERTRPGLARELHTIASTWFAERHLIGEAVDHALAGDHLELAVELVERHAMPHLEHSRMTTALGLLAQLPPQEVRTRPPLLVALAWANCLLQRPVPAQQALDQLRTLVQTSHVTRDAEQPALAREIDVVQACIDVYADRVDRAEGLVAPSLGGRPCRPFVGAVAANIRSFVKLAEFDFDAALHQQEEAQQLHQDTHGPFPGVYGRCFAGLAALAALDLDGAARHLHAALGLARDMAGRHSHAARLAGALLGELYYERDELDQATKLLEESRELGAESGVVDFMLATFGTLARCRAAAGRHADGLTLLAEGLEVAERLNLPRLKARMISEQIRLLLEAGRTREALRAAQSLPDGSQCHAGIATQIEWLRTATLGQVLTADGNATAAIGLFQTLLERTTSAGHPLWQVRARLHLACAQEAGRFLNPAVTTVAPALRRAAAEGLCRTVLDAGPQIATIVSRLLMSADPDGDKQPAGAPPEYLNRLLARAPTQPGSPVVRPSPTPQSLSVRALAPQELRILQMLERGLTNARVAAELNVSVNTVKWYLKNIYSKLGVTNRTQCVVAYRHSFSASGSGRGPLAERRTGSPEG